MAATTMLWRLDVAKGREAEFEALVSGLVRDVHANEPGQIFEYRKTRGERPQYILFLSFFDEEAFARYSAAPYHTGVSPAIIACLDGAPQGEPLDVFR